MRPRQDIIEIFSTFLQFDADRFRSWAIDPKLRRSMQNYLARLPKPETSENFWALYWHKVWLPQPASLARTHLSAYLQEPCYWAAQKTIASFSITQYSLSDCFQIAIAQVDRALKGFDPKQGATLKNYASAIFSGVIKDNLRQRHEASICTDWALLRKLSQKQLVESLQTAGLTSETIAGYVLAWNCFKSLYIPTQATATRKLSKPDSATWEAIASLYNAQRHQQLHPPSPECNPETLEKWLLSCAKAARAYLYPPVTSINTPIPGQESVELQDNLPASGEESLLAEIIAQEEEQSRHSKLAQINTILVAAVAQLKPQAQQLLQLYYSQGLTQQQMAQQLDMKQYTVSRRLTKARESLLLALAQWSRDTLHISLNSDVIKNTSTLLEEWLKVQYNHPNQPSHRESPYDL